MNKTLVALACTAIFALLVGGRLVWLGAACLGAARCAAGRCAASGQAADQLTENLAAQPRGGGVIAQQAAQQL